MNVTIAYIAQRILRVVSLIDFVEQIFVAIVNKIKFCQPPIRVCCLRGTIIGRCCNFVTTSHTSAGEGTFLEWVDGTLRSCRLGFPIVVPKRMHVAKCLRYLTFLVALERIRIETRRKVDVDFDKVMTIRTTADVHGRIWWWSLLQRELLSGLLVPHKLTVPITAGAPSDSANLLMEASTRKLPSKTGEPNEEPKMASRINCFADIAQENGFREERKQKKKDFQNRQRVSRESFVWRRRGGYVL